MSAPVREPFGQVTQARLRNLANKKNTQNATPTPISSSVKPHDVIKSFRNNMENVDPINFIPTKGKVFNMNISADGKTKHFHLSAAKTTKDTGLPQMSGHKRKSHDDVPQESSSKRRNGATFKTPVPAGRSPVRKFRGIKDRAQARGYVGINPPTFSSPSIMSLNEAVFNTATKKRYQKNWDFQIYEDTPEDLQKNLDGHTFDVLEETTKSFGISLPSSPKGAEENLPQFSNKENEPPSDYFAMAQPLVARQDRMGEDIRTPLADLNAKDFYADGCDEHTAIFVPGEEDEPAHKDNNLDTITEAPQDHAQSCGQDGWEGLLAEMSHTKEILGFGNFKESQMEESEFQIWESESAKAEDDVAQQTVATAAVTETS